MQRSHVSHVSLVTLLMGLVMASTGVAREIKPEDFTCTPRMDDAPAAAVRTKRHSQAAVTVKEMIIAQSEYSLFRRGKFRVENRRV